MRSVVSSKTLEPTAEVRAFIYQQMNELENVLPEGSTVGVQLNEAQDQIVATIEINSVTGKLVSRGVGEEPIAALIDAKEAMTSQLDDLNKVIRLHSEDRSYEVEDSEADARLDRSRGAKGPKYRH